MQLSPSDPDIQTILRRIRLGDLDLQPDFQRGEVWTISKKKRLIDSILRNWYVPPVHTVLVADSNKQDVLDGQQRLAAIRDFAEDEFSVDGRIAPVSAEVFALHGLTYSKLPPQVRRAFDAFTIRVIRISDYLPEEPGELFFRLNQITSITAAEQRNAFYGPVRHQVKDLVERFQLEGNSPDTLGFSNSRMAYDDVISKLLCTLETGDLSQQLTASYMSDRFRSERPFEDDAVKLSERSIIIFSLLRRGSDQRLRFNKATLFSWLVVIAAYAKYNAEGYLLKSGPTIISAFESQRMEVKAEPYEFKRFPGNRDLFGARWSELLSLFSDRSTSRVLDTTSVVYRDFVLHLFIVSRCEVPPDHLPFSQGRLLQYEEFIRAMEAEPIAAETVLETVLSPAVWGRI